MTDSILTTLERYAKANDLLYYEPLFRARVRIEYWDVWHCLKCEGVGFICLGGSTANRMECRSCRGTGKGTHQNRYELAAYLGHVGARGLLDYGEKWGHVGTLERHGFDAFLLGIQHWCPGQMFMIAGACAAGWVAWNAWWNSSKGYGWRVSKSGYPEPRHRALEAVEAWIACPCKEHKEKCDIPHLPDAFDALVSIVTGNGIEAAQVAITSFAIMADESNVREVLCKAWIERVLYAC